MKAISLTSAQHAALQKRARETLASCPSASKAVEILSIGPTAPVASPGIEHFRGILKDYQRDLCDWMAERGEPKDGYPAGGCLLLTPGLGKTLTTLYYLFSAAIKKRPPGVGPVILVMARNCRQIWLDELAKIANWMNVTVRVGILSGCEMDIDSLDFIVTTPNRLGNMEKARECGDPPKAAWTMNVSGFFRRTFSDVVVDEADMLRNGESTTWWKGVAAVKRTRTWALTGTPVHKDVSDFYALLELVGVQPALAQAQFAVVRQIMTRRMNQEDLARINPEMRLPPCNVHEHITAFGTEEEATAYAQMFNRTREFALSDVMSSVPGSSGARSAITFGAHLTTLRRSCVIPALACGVQSASPDVEEPRSFVLTNGSVQMLLRDIGRKRFRKSAEVSGPGPRMIPIPPGPLGEQSTKMVAVTDFVLAHYQSTPLLVFSQWLQPILLLQTLLKRGGVDGVEVYHGMMTNEAQDETIRNVRRGLVRVMIATLGSAQASLNLTEFKRVVFMDPVPDPQATAQAVGRVHRYGQTAEVNVHHFLIENTVEMRMYELARSHQRLAEDIVDGGLSVPTKIVINAARFLNEFDRPPDSVSQQWRSSAIRATAAATATTLNIQSEAELPSALRSRLSDLSSPAASPIRTSNGTSNGSLMWSILERGLPKFATVTDQELASVHKIGAESEQVQGPYLLFTPGSSVPSLMAPWRNIDTPILCFESIAAFKAHICDNSNGKIARFTPYRGLFDLMAKAASDRPSVRAIFFQADKRLLMFRRSS